MPNALQTNCKNHSLQCSKTGWTNNSVCTMHGACDSSQEPGSHCFLPPLIMHCNSTSTVHALLTTDNEKCMTEVETFTLSQTSPYRLAQPLSCKQHFRYAHRKLVWFISANRFLWTVRSNNPIHQLVWVITEKCDRAHFTRSFCIVKCIISHKTQLLIN